jgi:hypothetical protein
VTEWSVSHKIKQKHILTKDVVGLLLDEVVSNRKTTSLQRIWLPASRGGSKYKKKHIVAKDVLGLLVGDSKNVSLTKIKTS